MHRRSFLGAMAAPILLPVSLAEKFPTIRAKLKGARKYQVVAITRHFAECMIEVDIRSLEGRETGKLNIEHAAPGFQAAWDLEIGDEVYFYREAR